MELGQFVAIGWLVITVLAFVRQWFVCREERAILGYLQDKRDLNEMRREAHEWRSSALKALDVAGYALSGPLRSEIDMSADVVASMFCTVQQQDRCECTDCDKQDIATHNPILEEPVLFEVQTRASLISRNMGGPGGGFAAGQKDRKVVVRRDQ